MGLVHGDDFVFCGSDEDMNWVAEELKKTILLKVVGKLGDDEGPGTSRRSDA